MTLKATLPILALSILASSSAIKPAAAASASASINVSATVQASCLAAITSTAVGTGAVAKEAAPAVSVSCSNSVPYNITLNAEVARSATVAFRPGSGSRFPLLTLAPNVLSGRAANRMIVIVTY